MNDREDIMDRLRKWCYGNQRATFFQEHKTLINAYNVHINDIMLRLIPVLSALYLVNSYLLMGEGNPYIRQTCWFFIVCFSLLSHIRKKNPWPFLRHSLLDSLICGEISFLFLLMVGPISDPGNVSVYHPVFFFMLFLLYVIPLHHLALYCLLHFILYSVLDIYCKGYTIAVADITNVMICAIGGFMLGGNVLKSRLSEIASYDLLKRQSEEKLAKANALASKDSMTHVGNRRAYQELEEELNELIEQGRAPAFAVVVCDVNGLKAMNDTGGHKKGDRLIQKCCADICSVYVHSPVFRYGGDEFVVILRDGDYENREVHFRQLRSYTEFSSGMAIFTASGDKTVADVFQRADLRMYAHKNDRRH